VRTFDTATASYHADRTARDAHVLFWIEAVTRGTGAPAPLGLWSGDDAATFTIGGVSRAYAGAGQVLAIDPIVSEEGLTVRTLTVRIAAMGADVAQLLRGYDARAAPVEIHEAMFDPLTGALIAEPLRIYRGTVQRAPIPTSAPGGVSIAELHLASAALDLTRTLPSKKSNAAQSARSGDTFRAYAHVSAAVNVPWGKD